MDYKLEFNEVANVQGKYYPETDIKHFLIQRSASRPYITPVPLDKCETT